MVKVTYAKKKNPGPYPRSASDDHPGKQPGWEHLDPDNKPINKHEEGQNSYQSEFWRWTDYPPSFQSEWQVERGNEAQGFPYQHPGQPIRAGMPTGRQRAPVDFREYVPVSHRQNPARAGRAMMKHPLAVHAALTRSEHLFLEMFPEAEYIDAATYDFLLDGDRIEIKEVSGARKLKAKLSQLTDADYFFVVHYPSKISMKPSGWAMLLSEELRECMTNHGNTETSKARGDVYTIQWKNLCEAIKAQVKSPRAFVMNPPREWRCLKCGYVGDPATESYGEHYEECPGQNPHGANPLVKYNLVVNPGSANPAAVIRLEEQLAEGIARSSDVCEIVPTVCVGNLGIPRSHMPQLRDDVVHQFLAYQESKGNNVVPTQIRVGELKATQREINAEKVFLMLEAYRRGNFSGIRDPVITSEDNYILDGHHRWATLLVADPENFMNVYAVAAPVTELLDDAASFGGVSAEAFNNPAGVANTILQQLGGNRFAMMTGARNFIDHGNALSLDFPRPGAGKPNHLKITLEPDDTYSMEFGSKHGTSYRVLNTIGPGVYAEDLQRIFTDETGLYTRFNNNPTDPGDPWTWEIPGPLYSIEAEQAGVYEDLRQTAASEDWTYNHFLDQLENSTMSYRRNPERTPVEDPYYPDQRSYQYSNRVPHVYPRGSPLYPPTSPPEENPRRNPYSQYAWSEGQAGNRIGQMFSAEGRPEPSDRELRAIFRRHFPSGGNFLEFQGGFSQGYRGGYAMNPNDRQMEMQGNYEQKRPGHYLPRNNPGGVWDSLSYTQRQQAAHAAGYKKVNSIAGKAWGAQSKAARAKLNPVIAPGARPEDGRSTQYYRPLPHDPLGDRGRYSLNESWQVTPQFSVDHQSPSGSIIGEIGYDVADPRSFVQNPGGAAAHWCSLSRPQREQALRNVGYGIRGVNLNAGKKWNNLSKAAQAKLNPGSRKKTTARKNPGKKCPKGHTGLTRLKQKYATNPGGTPKTTWSCAKCRAAGGTGHYQ